MNLLPHFIVLAISFSFLIAYATVEEYTWDTIDIVLVYLCIQASAFSFIYLAYRAISINFLLY